MVWVSALLIAEQRRASQRAPCDRLVTGAVAGGNSLQETAQPAACIGLASPMDPNDCYLAGLALLPLLLRGGDRGGGVNLSLQANASCADFPTSAPHPTPCPLPSKGGGKERFTLNRVPRFWIAQLATRTPMRGMRAVYDGVRPGRIWARVSTDFLGVRQYFQRKRRE